MFEDAGSYGGEAEECSSPMRSIVSTKGQAEDVNEDVNFVPPVSKEDMYVYKLGQASGLTRGKVLFDLVIYNKAFYMFIEWERVDPPFALNGDCGSIYYVFEEDTGSYKPVAVHTASALFCESDESPKKISLGIPLCKVNFKGYDVFFSPDPDLLNHINTPPYLHGPNFVTSMDRDYGRITPQQISVSK